MVLLPMRPILEAAERGKYAVGAFNVNNMEQAQAIMNAAKETDSPIIYQVSRGALEYSDKEILRDIVLCLCRKNPKIPVALHLDHGNSPETCLEAITLGFTSVMMDGSLHEDGKTPSDYEYNRKVTSEVVNQAHKRGVSVEAEIGRLGGIEDGHGSDSENLTDPDDVRKLYDDCRMDACAVAWGTKHGAYKGEKGQPPKLDHSVITRTHESVPEVFLVSHGSSSLPANLRDLNNKYGVFKKYHYDDGHVHICAYEEDFDLDSADPKDVLEFLVESQRMGDSVGVPMSDLRQAIKEGVRKINVDTDGRMAVTGRILETLCDDYKNFDPRSYLGSARKSIKDDFAMNAMTEFGSAGKAGDVEDRTLHNMKIFYAKNA